jgi:hypothetical protein
MKMSIYRNNTNAVDSGARIELYFVDVVRGIYDQYFMNGHALCRCERTDLVRYEATNWFAEIFYFWTDGPRYSPRVAVGCIPDAFNDDPRRNRVDVMYIVPDGSSLRRYNADWRYRNETEARVVFARVRDEIVEPHVMPFLADSSRLHDLLMIRRQELDRQWKEEIQDHNEVIARRAADDSFRARQYDEFLEKMSSISADSLSAADRKKVEFALKQVGRKDV